MSGKVASVANVYTATPNATIVEDPRGRGSIFADTYCIIVEVESVYLCGKSGVVGRHGG